MSIENTNDAESGAGNRQTGSVVPSRTAFSPARLGSSRPARPGQMDPALAEQIAGGLDPQEVSEMAHVSAAALLDRVHRGQDPQIVGRVLTLVDREGVDVIAALWSNAEPDSLPGIMWRLYLLRSWMRNNGDAISNLWQLGEPEATAASAIAGVDRTPSAGDIARIADSILSGAFTGDFAVALERACAFTDVIAHGLRVQAQQTVDAEHDADDFDQARVRAARLLHTSGNLMTTSHDFRTGANLWRRGRLE